jgi:hypothetical protein
MIFRSCRGLEHSEAFFSNLQVCAHPPSLISQRSPVEVLNRNAVQVDSFEAANIDCGHPVALWIGAFSVRVNTARLAKAVLDNVLVERVRADVLFRCEHVQLFARH